MCDTCGCSNVKKLSLKEDLLQSNKDIAEKNRQIFSNHNILVLNLLSSPGAGKTTILEKTIRDIKNKFNITVIEGDQHTNRDAERISKTGVPVYQINTINACHLDAHMVSHAINNFIMNNIDIIFIENVGNLICPTEFDLGEDYKIVITSVTEGEDKPIKYPNTFLNASLVLLNKVDLLKVLNFDLQECIAFIKRVNPDVQILPVSAITGEGMNEWYSWLEQKFTIKKGG